MREAAFSLIADWAGTAGAPAEEMLAQLSFLDLYAGSAAVALEAASRGAAPVWAVESDQSTARIARGNATATGLTVTVVTQTVEKALAAVPPTGFDVVWADPPYGVSVERLAPVLSAVFERGWLAPDGLLVLERASRDDPPVWPSGVTDGWHRRYGETTLHFATKGS